MAAKLPYHENRKYLHYFGNFGKQNWYREYTPCLALFRLFMTSRLWPPEAAAPLLGHTQVAKWLQQQDCYGKELKIELIRAPSILRKPNSCLQRNFYLFIMLLYKKLPPIYTQYCAMSMILQKTPYNLIVLVCTKLSRNCQQCQDLFLKLQKATRAEGHSEHGANDRRNHNKPE